VSCGDDEAYIGFRDAIDAVAVADVALSKRTLELAIATDVVVPTVHAPTPNVTQQQGGKMTQWCVNVREVGVQNKPARSERLSLLSGRIAWHSAVSEHEKEKEKEKEMSEAERTEVVEGDVSRGEELREFEVVAFALGELFQHCLCVSLSPWVGIRYH
jgi:hypothetical protein